MIKSNCGFDYAESHHPFSKPRSILQGLAGLVLSESSSCATFLVPSAFVYFSNVSPRNWISPLEINSIFDYRAMLHVMPQIMGNIPRIV